MNNLHLHPMMVHFPLALTLAGALCLLCSRLPIQASLRSSLATAGTWNVIFGGVTILMTLGSGLGAALHLHLYGGAQYSVSRHVIWAVCTSQLVVVLALWRALASGISSPPSWLYLGLLLIACAGLIVTAYYGGENVYHYALGVRQMRP